VANAFDAHVEGMSDEHAVTRPRGSDMQSKPVATDHHRTVLIIGISRGIGRGLAAEYLRRGWSVSGTVHFLNPQNEVIP